MWPAHMPRATTRRRGGAVLTNTTEIGTAMLPLRSVTIPARADVSPSALAYVRACVRTAGDAGQVAWRIPAASAAGIVRSGPGAGRDVRECETEILCASEPDGLAAGAGALPGARRRCEAGKRTHGPGPRACLALLAATALLALAAPAQAQTEVWSATLTPGDIRLRRPRLQQRRFNTGLMQQHLRPLRRQLHATTPPTTTSPGSSSAPADSSNSPSTPASPPRLSPPSPSWSAAPPPSSSPTAPPAAPHRPTS